MSYDAERIVADYLRGEGIRTVAVTPPNRDAPWVRLTELEAPQDPTSQVDHLVRHYFQLDCYAGAPTATTGGPREANELAGAVREALARLRGQHDGATVTATRVGGGPRDQDRDVEPARDRKIVTASVWMHP